MPRNLPIALVRAFETAARRGSFKSAAQELGLTASAISHAVHKLEDHLGTQLFDRGNRGVTLNPDGEELMRHIGGAFEDIRHGLEVVSARKPRLLRVHCAPSFAAQWLSPRLPRLVEELPDIDVRLSASANYTRFETDVFDIDIVYGPVRDAALVSVPLGLEAVTPMCDPETARSIRTIDDLLAHKLIDSDNKQVRWSEWFEVNGREPPGANGSRFDRSFLAIAFAVDGMGVALESTMLAEREIAAGRLVAPLFETTESVYYTGHHIVTRRAALQRQAVRRFIGWIAAERGVEADLESAAATASSSAPPRPRPH